MITIRRSDERGHADHGWLDTYHTFSFADYYDPRHMQFRTLRVLNEDRVAAAAGFPSHPHRDMEIITYVVSGAVAHKDSMGNDSVLRAGELQRMTAGRGVVHSEFNPSPSEPLHLLQIWILPRATGLPPSYEQKPALPAEDGAPLRLIVSPNPANDEMRIHQDVRIYTGRLRAQAAHLHTLEPGRAAWLQLISGSIKLEGEVLSAGDGASVENAPELNIEGVEDAEFLLFDLA